MFDICENCYEEANLVKVQKMNICKSCKQDMSEMGEDAVLGNYDDMMGVMSDDDVIDMYRNEYAGY